MGDSIKLDDRAACNKTPDCVFIYTLLQKGKWDAAQMLEVHRYRVTINSAMEVTFFCSVSPGLVRSTSLSPEKWSHSSPRRDSGIPSATRLRILSVRNMWTPRPNSVKWSSHKRSLTCSVFWWRQKHVQISHQDSTKNYLHEQHLHFA